MYSTTIKNLDAGRRSIDLSPPRYLSLSETERPCERNTVTHWSLWPYRGVISILALPTLIKWDYSSVTIRQSKWSEGWFHSYLECVKWESSMWMSGWFLFSSQSPAELIECSVSWSSFPPVKERRQGWERIWCLMIFEQTYRSICNHRSLRIKTASKRVLVYHVRKGNFIYPLAY